MAIRFVPARLTTKRVLAGLSRADLADRAGLSTEAVRLIEIGDSDPRPATVAALAKALAVEAESLYEIDGEDAA